MPWYIVSLKSFQTEADVAGRILIYTSLEKVGVPHVLHARAYFVCASNRYRYLIKTPSSSGLHKKDHLMARCSHYFIGRFNNSSSSILRGSPPKYSALIVDCLEPVFKSVDNTSSPFFECRESVKWIWRILTLLNKNPKGPPLEKPKILIGRHSAIISQSPVSNSDRNVLAEALRDVAHNFTSPVKLLKTQTNPSVSTTKESSIKIALPPAHLALLRNADSATQVQETKWFAFRGIGHTQQPLWLIENHHAYAYILDTVFYLLGYEPSIRSCIKLQGPSDTITGILL